MWSSSVFWKNSQIVIHIPFTFQWLIPKALTTFIINYSTAIFGTWQSQTRETSAGLGLYNGINLLLPPSCNSPSPLQLEKSEGQQRDNSLFSQSHLCSTEYTDYSGFSITSEWRHCGLLEVYAELWTSKISNILLSTQGNTGMAPGCSITDYLYGPKRFT